MTEEEAAEAIEKTKNAKIDGKPITVLYSVAKDRAQKSKFVLFFLGCVCVCDMYVYNYIN